MASKQEVNWERLDKRKFFVHGAAIFTGLTATLYPLTVIKTRMMVLDGAHTGIRGAFLTARDLYRHDGPRGLYKGFGTVLCGLIPARMVYLAVLEATKSGVHTMLRQYPDLSDTAVASSASFIAGGLASLGGQLVIVPIDVISQRLMIMGGGVTAAATSPSPSMATARKAGSITGLHLARQIIQQEGFKGLYRGFGASVATFVPSSAIWWSAYGGWQSVLWHQLVVFGALDASQADDPSVSNLVGVQVVAGVLTGCTSAVITNPLDVIKTRLQTRKDSLAGATRMTWGRTASALLQAEGIGGLFRGVAPRMMSTSIWGTAMVTTYEFLKRLCVLPDAGDA